MSITEEDAIEGHFEEEVRLEETEGHEQEIGGKRKREEDSINEPSPKHLDNKKNKMDNARSDFDEDGAKTNGETTSSLPVDYIGALPAGSTWRVLSQTTDALVMEIPQERVGQVIGAKGAVIQDIQSRSGARVAVHQNFPPGVPRQVEIQGTREQINLGLELVRRIVETGPAATNNSGNSGMSGGPTISTTIECNQPQVGRIIGANGATIKDIQSKSGARVQIDQDYPPDVPRKINITGTAAAVSAAVQMVTQLIAQSGADQRGGGGGSSGFKSGGSGNIYGSQNQYGNGGGGQQYGAGAPAYNRQAPPAPMLAASIPAANPYGPAPVMGMPGGADGAEVRQVIDVSKSIVGKIIGKGGETIQNLIRKSGAHITVDQNVPEGYPCKVHVVGIAHNVNLAQSMIQEIQMGVHSNKVGLNLPPPIVGNITTMPAYPPQQASVPPNYGMPAYGMPPYNPYAPQPVQYNPYAMPATTAYNPYGQPMQPSYVPSPAPAPIMPAASARGGGGGAHNPPPAAAPPAAAANEWTEYKDDEGRSYWYSSKTGVSQWQKPPGFR
jgi:far upstream element-binding protein